MNALLPKNIEPVEETVDEYQGGRFMRNGIMDSFIKATKKVHVKRYQSHKFCYDIHNNSIVEYDAGQEVEWEEYGESEHIKKAKDLTFKLEQLKSNNIESWFKFFLDGSRHAYKVDDVAIGKNVYPIIAGQIGISCCRRDNGKMKKVFFYRKLVVSIPTCAISSEFSKPAEAAKLLEKLNMSGNLVKRNLRLDDILLYNLDSDEKFENKGVAKIQDYMITQEKEAVLSLVKQGAVNAGAYLIKDGSLEYKATHDSKMNLSDARMKNAYQYVIGVSKSFNPTLCHVKGGGTNASIVAGLKKNERTPACCYRSKLSGEGVSFCVWYLRLRDSKYTQNVFDGIVKVEKLIQEDEKQEGVDSELVDTISAFLLMERNPVAYGNDNRWANHLYPVFVTENFAKSKYIYNDTFLKLF